MTADPRVEAVAKAFRKVMNEPFTRRTLDEEEAMNFLAMLDAARRCEAEQKPSAMGRECSLADCPIGLFVTNGSGLCLKTECGDNAGMIDAYICSSGERLWGPAPQTVESQRAMRVRPVNLDEILDHLKARQP